MVWELLVLGDACLFKRRLVLGDIYLIEVSAGQACPFLLQIVKIVPLEEWWLKVIIFSRGILLIRIMLDWVRDFRQRICRRLLVLAPFLFFSTCGWFQGLDCLFLQISGKLQLLRNNSLSGWRHQAVHLKCLPHHGFLGFLDPCGCRSARLMHDPLL